jgi:hypothetical protein
MQGRVPSEVNPDKMTGCTSSLRKLICIAALGETFVSKRIDKSWTVFVSVENAEHDRCVDIFSRADGSYGFEEFRRDIEDRGHWTPVQHYSDASYVAPADALDAAERSVLWLTGVLARKPELRRRIGLG